MRIFPNYNKPGKGVSKDDANPKGFELFWQLFITHYASLMAINILFILSAVLIIPFGAALKGLSRTTLSFVRFQYEKPLQTFFNAFKTDFIKTSFVGIASLAMMAALGFSLYTHWTSGNSVMVGLSIVLILMFLAFNMYAFKMLAVLDLPLGTVIKNSVLLSLISPAKLALCFLFVVLPSFLFFCFPAISGAIIILILFSLNSLITSVICWDVMQKHIVKD